MITKTMITPGASYIEWSSVIAGTILALAISLIFLQFGGMLGLETFHPDQSNEKTRWMIITVSVWLFWVQLISSLAGGYIAGRVRGTLDLSTSESEVRDGAHGLLVWALGTVLAVIAASIGSFWTALVGDPTPAIAHHQEVVEHLTKTTAVIFGFGAAAGSLVSAAAACWTAIIAGKHRNEMSEFRVFVRRTPARR